MAILSKLYTKQRYEKYVSILIKNQQNQDK